jgi:diacylglycerol kinase
MFRVYYTVVMLHKKVASFRYAFAGLRLAWREEANFRFEAAFGLATAVLGAIFGISPLEWLVLVLWFALVLSAEAFNTALEELCDMLRQTHDPHVAKIKDLAAAAVLLTSLGAAVSGLIIFVPRVLSLL